MSWRDTVDYCQILGLEHVPVLYDGLYDRQAIMEAFDAYGKDRDAEGFVIRTVLKLVDEVQKQRSQVRQARIQTGCQRRSWSLDL